MAKKKVNRRMVAKKKMTSKKSSLGSNIFGRLRNRGTNTTGPRKK